ncbi:uncharacterized protein RB166_002175 [Leptodactylus fuscus]
MGERNICIAFVPRRIARSYNYKVFPVSRNIQRQRAPAVPPLSHPTSTIGEDLGGRYTHWETGQSYQKHQSSNVYIKLCYTSIVRYYSTYIYTIEVGYDRHTLSSLSMVEPDTRTVAEPHGTGAQQPTQRPQTRQDGGSGRTSSGNAWSRGAPSFASNSSYTGQAFRRRNVVRFRHGGAKEDLPDRRFVVRELLCTQMGFVPTDILAVINLPDRQGYDVSFKLMSDLDRFWANLTRLRDTEGWDKFSFIPISRPDTASVTIVFWNEAVPPQDIVIWLRRHCDLMSDLSKNRDEDGVWTGGWRVLVKLRQQNNITQHLPNSFFIGREKGICFYAGQPRRCFKCGKAGHVASVCSMVKCSLCNEMGHVSATCQNIRCNLCGRIGHPHRDCPDAWHNICKDSPDEDLLAAADDIQEEEEALLSGVSALFYNSEVLADVDVNCYRGKQQIWAN